MTWVFHGIATVGSRSSSRRELGRRRYRRRELAAKILQGHCRPPKGAQEKVDKIKLKAHKEEEDDEAARRAVESGEDRSVVAYGGALHLRHVVTGRWLRADGEPARSGGGLLRVSLAMPDERASACRFHLSPGFRARGEGTPVFKDDEVLVASPALTLSPAHPARLVNTPAGEAALGLGESPRLTIGRFATRAPSECTTAVDALRFVRLIHREDDSLLVASTNAFKKKGVGSEPYVRRADVSLIKSRRRRDVDISPIKRGDAAAATWIVRGVAATCDVDSPRRRVAATPRPRGG